MQPYSLAELYTCYSKVTEDIILFLPRTSNLNQLAKCSKQHQKIQVMHYCMNGASKVLTLIILSSWACINFSRHYVYITEAFHQLATDQGKSIEVRGVVLPASGENENWCIRRQCELRSKEVT